ncbi:hypothetical protein SLS57_009936 [Botryosphaeria dothidea]
MENRAAWITEAKAKPFKVDAAPYPTAGPGEIIVKNFAVALNHIDWKIQDFGIIIQKYPNILGLDVTGVVVEVGPGVTRFEKGQRIVATSPSFKTGNPAHGGFQLYTAVLEDLALPVPDSMAFEQSAVLPTSVTTAASGLYNEDKLGLPLPSENPKPAGKTILVWGGSSAVGSMAVQLAAASGVKAIAIASTRNHALVRALGASTVIDYKSPDVVDEIVAAINDGSKDFAGVFDAISEPDSYEKLTHQVFAIDILLEKNAHVQQEVWTKFLPDALASGQIKVFPEPSVVGEGLESIQEGLEKLKAGVSAQKLVVKL